MRTLAALRLLALLAIGLPLSGQGFVLVNWPEFEFGGAAGGPMFTVDMDGDGMPDFVRTTGPRPPFGTSGPIERPGIALSRRDGRFQEVANMPVITGATARMSVGDVDGDGFPDIVFPCWSPPNIPSIHHPHVLLLTRATAASCSTRPAA